MARRRPETRAEERARGYVRPARQAGVSEYAYRTRGLTGEARARAAGQRGPAAFERALESGRTVRVEIRGKHSDQVIARVIDSRGNMRVYILQRKPPPDEAGEREAGRNRDRWADIADQRGVDFDWSVSP